jgi:5-methylcytosine-specific restriction endonuclease McrA
MTNLWAPKCALPDCINRVSYHDKYNRSGQQAPGYKWKMFCTHHRGKGKTVVEDWKIKQGCSNTDAHHGFKCTSHITKPGQLDVNHIDGDRHNNDPTNLELLCRVCHQRVTTDNGHHLTRYTNSTHLPPELFEVGQ